MFIEKLLCVVGKGAEVVLDWFVTAVNGGVEHRVLNVNPE
jgi:hypothetical protein